MPGDAGGAATIGSMFSQQATAEGTAKFAARFPELRSSRFFRSAQEWTVSSIGIGSYLGDMSEAVDRGYEEALTAAVRSGINFVDTSLNYRNQRSELSIGRALKHLIAAGELDREEFVVCTKAGYLVPGALPKGLRESDVVGGMHCMTPEFLENQLERSRENLGLGEIDVFYLHNPETQLDFVDRTEFYARVRKAFTMCEAAAEDGRIQYYGMATWNGFRNPEQLSLPHLVAIAREIGGDRHRFRFIQLPYNLAMLEAMRQTTYEGKNVLEQSVDLGVTAVASASLLQSRLSRNLPEPLHRLIRGVESDAQRAIQFTRSAPGIAVALVGMSNPAHVSENLGVARVAPIDFLDYLKLLA